MDFSFRNLIAVGLIFLCASYGMAEVRFTIHSPMEPRILVTRDFGGVNQNDNKTLVVTVNWWNLLSFAIGPSSILGANVFTHSNPCVGSHGGAGSCSFSVNFHPTSIGDFSATLSMPYTEVRDIEGEPVSSGGTRTWDLTGSGLEKPPEDDDQERKCGSIVLPETRVLQENVPLVGTGMDLIYTTAFTSAYNSTGRFSSKFGFRKEGWLISKFHYYDLNQQRLFSGLGVKEQRPYKVRSDGKVLVVSSAGDEVYVFDTDGQHHNTLSSLTGAILYTFGYDANERLITITDAYGNVTTITRDSNANGSISHITSPYGQVTVIGRNSSNQITSVTSPGNRTYSMSYKTGTSLLETFTKPGGQISHFTYETTGQLKKDLAHGGNFWELLENSNSEIELTSAMGRESIYGKAYSSSTGYSRFSQAPSGLVMETFDNELGNIVKETQVERIETSKIDDERFGSALKRILQSIYTTEGTSVTTEYGASVTDGVVDEPFTYTQLTNTINKAGRISTIVFNQLTSKMTSTSPSGATQESELNSNDQIVSRRLGSDIPVSLSYDSRGRLEETSQGSKNLTTYSYNSHGLVASITNARSEQVSFLYDDDNRMISKTLPGSRTVLFQYDDNGNLTGIRPPGRPLHEVIFNAMELPETYMPPSLAGGGLKNTAYQYNLDRQLTKVTRPNGKTATFNYDLFSGLLTSVATAPGSYVHTYSTSKPGLISQTVSPYAVKSVYTYHGAIPTAEEQFRNGATSVGKVTFGLDSSLRISSRTIRDSSSASVVRNITLNDDDRPTQYGDMSISYSYPSGRVSTTTLQNISDIRTYDSYGNLASYTSKFSPSSGPPQVLYSYTFTRDIMSRISGMNETIRGTTAAYEFGYDVAGRLNEVKKNGNTFAVYQYDSNGNRVSQTVNGKTVTSTFDDQDRIINFGGKTYSFDRNGDLQGTQLGTGASESYQYDVMGNLVSGVNTRGNAFEFLMDGKDRRVAKKSGTQTVQRFLYQDGLRVAAELDGNGLLKSEFIYATNGNSPDYMLKNGVKYVIIRNHLGSPRLVVNAATGVIAQQVDYDIWGNVLRDSNTCFQPFGFAGGLRDPDHKLLRFGARDYDPETGRWTSKDPILFNGGDTNLFGYAANDPINKIDPNGLSYVIYDRAAGNIQIFSGMGELIGAYAATNNVSSKAPAGPVPTGVFEYSHYVDHAGEASASSRYGSNGNFVFNFPNGTGIGIHSGRQGACDGANRCDVNHATNGCIRSTDDATSVLKGLLTSDPLTSIIVL